MYLAAMFHSFYILHFIKIYIIYIIQGLLVQSLMVLLVTDLLRFFCPKMLGASYSAEAPLIFWQKIEVLQHLKL